jgi:DUF438 domain-containing protein
MSELFGDTKRQLKELIRALHAGVHPEEVKKSFQEILADLSPADVARVEQELIEEGLLTTEVRKLCDVHLAIFRESLDKEKVSTPPGHPIHILMEEHKIISQSAEELKNVAQRITEAKDTASIRTGLEQLGHIVEHLKDAESHHIREENVLFPYLEKHGITQPPAIMWMEHDEIRKQKKRLYALAEKCQAVSYADFPRELDEVATSLAQLIPSHVYKENQILYPTALKVITPNEWKDIRKQFDDLGYCCFTPESARGTETVHTSAAEARVEHEKVMFETGSLSHQELETMLNTLPLDITFVDKDDVVRYFSKPRERIFPRAIAVIGRKVQQCHPQKSVHVVNQVLQDFKSGKRDSAEFWIELKDRKIYIRYFALRNHSGDYLGCMEATQDITNIQKLRGEKRLLEPTQ